MTSEFDELQELITADMRKTYTEATIDHALNPRNLGDMEDADGFGKVTGPCGDTMEIWLKIKNAILAEATFLTDGCGTSIAAGSMLTELARGKSISEALKITQQDVLDALGGLPQESVHCALLAANTLREALKDYFGRQRGDFRALKEEPWKKAYRKH